jgi:hypothetical protein
VFELAGDLHELTACTVPMGKQAGTLEPHRVLDGNLWLLALGKMAPTS